MLIYYIVALLAFMADLIIHKLCFFPAISIIRILYYTQIFATNNLFKILFTGAILIIESFLYNGCCAIDLIVMVPLTVIAINLRNIVHLHKFVYLILSLIFLSVHYLVIDYGLFSRPLNCYFNFKIFGIQLLLLAIILKIMARYGRRHGRRLMH